MGMEPVRRDEEHEATLLRALGQRARGRICRFCGQPTAVRVRTPAHVRWLRLLGYRIKTYRCASCGQSFLRREDSPPEDVGARRS